MTSNHTIKKRVVAPFSQLLPASLKQKNISHEFIKKYTGITMIPYSLPGQENHFGILTLIKNKNDKKLELLFTALASTEPMWKCTLDQFDQLKRPRPNILCVETYGITTLFKFSDVTQSESLYEAVRKMQSIVKVVYQNEIGPQSSFEELDIFTWNQMQASMGIPGIGPELQSKASTVKKGKENRNVKQPKQKSIKNSFKTIINAAIRSKDLEKPKRQKKSVREDDETAPLLL